MRGWQQGPALVLAAALALPAGGQAQTAPLPAPAAEPLGEARPVPRPSPPAVAGEAVGNASGRAPEDAAESPPPVPSEALIPPEAYAGPVAPFHPAGPPAPEALRESDFDHAACRYGLTLLGVDFREAAPLADPAERNCGISRPVEVRAIQPGVTLDGGAVMRCDMARALALWTREVVIPAAGRMAGAPRLSSIAAGTGYVCRGVVGEPAAARLSEHALGNAIDIAGFGLADDGTRLRIAPAADRGDLATAFQNAVQGAACLYFTTVLGPGSNAAHDDHLHLDIRARNGLRLCQ